MEQESKYRSDINSEHSSAENISVAIVGAGAAGCMCAYFLLKSGVNVTLFDKGAPLRTLLPTGGGRCNLAYAEYDFKELTKNYPRGEKFLLSLFSRFSTWDTLALFEELGIKTYVQDDNRIFPQSNSAKEVREAILKKISRCKFVKSEVSEIKKTETGFIINDTYFTNVIVAIGGHAGYGLLENLGVKTVFAHPSLVGLNTQENFKDISGTVCKNAEILGHRGDVLFTHFGLSGPLIYKISSIKAFDKFPYELELDLYPDDFPLQNILNDNPHKELKNLLKEFLPSKIVSKIIEPNLETQKAHAINGKTRDMILNKIHHFKVTVTGTNKGEETVTAGGADLNEINPKTLEVKNIPRLYCIGEVLNIDGYCGGFNLQNAWTTGFIAAESIKQ